MKWNGFVLASLASVVMGMGVLSGCGGGGDSGSSAIEGNVVSFQNSSVAAAVAEPSNTPGLSGTPVAAAVAKASPGMGGPGGIMVSITGPTDDSTTTADDGSFSFTGLPAGSYGISCSFNGEEVRYRGESGQVATITVQTNETAQLLDMRISGGKMNIGNIHMGMNMK